jgi:hypothetical protein
MPPAALSERMEHPNPFSPLSAPLRLTAVSPAGSCARFGTPELRRESFLVHGTFCGRDFLRMSQKPSNATARTKHETAT